MSVPAGSARALSSLRNLFVAGKTDCNPEEEAVGSIIGDSCLRVRVKNTFIELDEDSEEEDPMPLSLWPRSKTEPNGTVGCDLLRGVSDVSTIASGDEDGGAPTIASSDEDGRASTTYEPTGYRARRGSSDELIDRLNSGGGYSLQVKNTFIELQDEDSEEEDPMSLFLWPRSKTEPNGVLGRDLLDPDEAGSDASSDEDGDAPTVDESAGDRAPTQVAFCSTPSPRSPASQLAFIRPPAPPAEPASPSPPIRAPAPAETLLCQPAPRPVFVQAPLLPTIRPLAALAGAWPGPLARPCAEECSGPPRRLRARRAPAGRRPVRPSSMPTVPLQSRLCSTADGFVRVRWTVDARKLRGSDKQLVSPPLDVDLGLGSGPAVFKIMLTASGGSTFSKSGGVGCVQVKCCSELGEDACTKVRISVGREEPRGPVPHCFSSIPVFSLPKELAECDFRAAVERQSNSMVVNVDISQFI